MPLLFLGEKLKMKKEKEINVFNRKLIVIDIDLELNPPISHAED